MNADCEVHGFQLRPDVRVEFPLPRDLTHRDVVRLSQYLAALVEKPAPVPEDRPSTPPPAAPSPPPPARGTGPARPRLLQPERLAEIRALAAQFEGIQAELGLCSSWVLRRVLAAFAARARAHGDGAGPETQDCVQRFVSLLARCSKQYWPGYVQVLQLGSRPDGILRDLDRAGTVTTWAEAAAIAETACVTDLRTGWFEGAAGGDPRAVIEVVTALVQRCSGPLGAPPTEVTTTEAQLVELAEHVTRLRGVRLAAARRPELARAWGLVFGRLRWLAQEVGASELTLALRESVNYQPPSVQAEADTERAEVVAARPGRVGEVAPWLLRAWDHLADVEIAPLLPPLTEAEFATIEAAVLRGAGEGTARRRRRRLRKLAVCLWGTPEAPTEPEPEDSTDVAEETSPLISAARALVAGQRALLLGNRNDPVLKATLERELGLAVTIVDTGRTTTVALANYDMVLVAESFCGHKGAMRYTSAARKAKVPVVWVHRGRLNAVARELLGQLAPEGRR